MLKLLAWLVVVLSLVALAAWFWPPTGYGFLAEAGVSLRAEEEPEPVRESKFETVSSYRLGECQLHGLEGCEEFRSDDYRTTTVMVQDGIYVGSGEVIADGVRGGLLRYIAVASVHHDDVRHDAERAAVYCVYGRVADGEVAAAVADLEPGAPVIYTTRLWWGDDGVLMRTYGDDGKPRCVVHFGGEAPQR